MIADLKKFLLRGNVVDLAVAVVIGVAFAAVISAFVDYIINPIIAAIFGEPDITGVLNITLRDGDADTAPTVLSIGGFLQALLDFIIIGTALFFVVQAYNRLQTMRSQTPPEAQPVPSDEVVLLTEIRDLLRTRT